MASSCNEWPTLKVADCAALQEGYVNPSQGVPAYFGNDIKWCRAVDLNDSFVWNTSRRLSRHGFESAGKSALLFEPGTLAISKSGTIGRLGILMDYMCGNRAVINIQVDESRFSNRFVFYSLLLRRPLIEELAAGSVQRNLYCSALGSVQISMPPLAEQRAIAHILGTLDDKIELNRRMNETLEGMARAIFKSWFVDFDPVRAKADGRQPAGMDPVTAALFPDSFEDSPLGRIPKGWKVMPLPDVIEVNPSRSLRKGEEAIYLDMQAMPTSGHRGEGWITRPFGSGTKFQNNDTLVARITPCLENGKTAFVDFLPDDAIGWGSTEFIVLRPKPPLPPEFAYYLARTDDFRAFAIQNMTGTSGRQRVPPGSLAQYVLTAPVAGPAEAFGRLAAGLMSRVRANSEQSTTLANLRDALLPRLLSGEIRVPEAEKLVEAAT